MRTSIVKIALEQMDFNYDKHEKINKLLSNAKLIKINCDEKIYFFDENAKMTFESDYEIIGKYDIKNKLWTWGWYLFSSNKNIINTSKKILHYGLNLDSTFDNAILKKELITPYININNYMTIEIYIALAQYLSKNEIVYEYLINEQYINNEKTPEQIKYINELFINNFYTNDEIKIINNIKLFENNIDDKLNNYVAYFLFLKNNQ
jgi:hypothetical protein